MLAKNVGKEQSEDGFFFFNSIFNCARRFDTAGCTSFIGSGWHIMPEDMRKLQYMTFRVCIKLYNEIVCHVNADLKYADCKQSIHKPYTNFKFPSSSVKQIM